MKTRMLIRVAILIAALSTAGAASFAAGQIGRAHV